MNAKKSSFFGKNFYCQFADFIKLQNKDSLTQKKQFL
jgi:hypothetical protein